MPNANELIILGDWGTSSCRLYLCRWQNAKLTVEDRKQGQGIKHTSEPEARFFDLCDSWFSEFGKLPVFLIGTVGADIGWRLTPYASCPTDHLSLLSEAVSFVARDIKFTIFPGLSCQNRHGLPDIMRGEETQVFGFLSQQKIPKEEQLICLPGTHAKWALLNNNEISSFVTSPVGELFEVLSHHSVLLNPMTSGQWCEHNFSHGLDVGLSHSSNLLHTLFAARAQQVIGQHTNVEASSYLSGLLIGADVKAAMQDFHLFSHVTLIGSDKVNSLYQSALEKLNITSSQFSSEWATIHGLRLLASERWKKYEHNE